jgi:hypothetical protein
MREHHQHSKKNKCIAIQRLKVVVEVKRPAGEQAGTAENNPEAL